jgi:hypothetical protein
MVSLSLPPLFFVKLNCMPPFVRSAQSSGKVASSALGLKYYGSVRLVLFPRISPQIHASLAPIPLAACVKTGVHGFIIIAPNLLCLYFLEETHALPN